MICYIFVNLEFSDPGFLYIFIFYRALIISLVSHVKYFAKEGVLPIKKCERIRLSSLFNT